MTNSKPWLPSAATISGVVGFEPGSPIWGLLEKAFEAALSEDDRNELHLTVAGYVARRWVTLDPSWASGTLAFVLVDEVEKSATALRSALHKLLNGGGVADRVSSLFGFALREAGSSYMPRTTLAGLESMAIYVDGLIRAADIVRELKLPKEIEATNKVDAFQTLVAEIAIFWEKRDKKPSTSGSVDAYGNASPFVVFIAEVLASLPSEYQHGSANSAGLTKKVQRALQAAMDRDKTPE